MPQECSCLPPGELDKLSSPARQFRLDLEAVLDAKSVMTRRQWTSLLEALVRIAAVAHVAWMCEVHRRLWDCVRGALGGAGPVEDVRSATYPRALTYLTDGVGSVPELRDRTSTYLAARLGLNVVLWALDDLGAPFDGKLSSAADVQRLLDLVGSNREALLHVVGVVADLMDREFFGRYTAARASGPTSWSSLATSCTSVRSPTRSCGATIRATFCESGVPPDEPMDLRARPRRHPHARPLLAGRGWQDPLGASPRAAMAEYGIVVDHRKIASDQLGAQLGCSASSWTVPTPSRMLLLRLPDWRLEREGARR